MFRPRTLTVLLTAGTAGLLLAGCASPTTRQPLAFSQEAGGNTCASDSLGANLSGAHNAYQARLREAGSTSTAVASVPENDAQHHLDDPVR